MTQILLVDDHPMFREGMALRISSQPDLAVCGEADSEDQALAHLKTIVTDLAIVDITLKDSHGLDLIKKIKASFPHIKILVVSAYEDSLYAERSLRAGAHGYINKRQCQDDIIDALRAVLEGKRYVSEEFQQSLLSHNFGTAVTRRSRGRNTKIDALSDRELTIFRQIGRGMSTGKIAENLHISPNTVESHRAMIKYKLGLKNGAKLRQIAAQWMLDDY